MNIFERVAGGRRYRIASQSVWDPARQSPFARQAVIGPADPPPVTGLGSVRTIGTRRTLAEIAATMVQVGTKEHGRRAAVLLAPALTLGQRKAVRIFELGGWMPALLSSMGGSESKPSVGRVA